MTQQLFGEEQRLKALLLSLPALITTSIRGLQTDIISRAISPYMDRCLPLDAFHQDVISRCLRAELPLCTPEQGRRLIEAVSCSMRAYDALVCGLVPFRELHDALADLWKLLAEDDPAIGLIRARVPKLPPEALKLMDRRAEWLWPKVFGQALSGGGVLDWSTSANPAELIRGLRLIIADGAAPVPGRRRPGGRQSRASMQPDILGVVRGSLENRSGSTFNGRPPEIAADQLVMWLALDWLHATGQPPKPGRSDSTPFGNLVQHIFGWLRQDNASAAMRRYWRSVAGQRATTAVRWN
jgi:hypothetical protein